MRLPTAAAYLNMTTEGFLGEVARGGLPDATMFAAQERWIASPSMRRLIAPPWLTGGFISRASWKPATTRRRRPRAGRLSCRTQQDVYPVA